jgi:hypothetical protein
LVRNGLPGVSALATFSEEKLGLNTIRKIFAAATPDQTIAFLDQLLSPKLPVKPLLALAF